MSLWFNFRALTLAAATVAVFNCHSDALAQDAVPVPEGFGQVGATAPQQPRRGNRGANNAETTGPRTRAPRPAAAAGAAAPRAERRAAASDALPEPMKEFRAAWVATVANIDWPSRPGLPVDVQKEELIKIMDKCKELNMNCVIYQVRPGCDAMYASELEPWSQFLTGEMGKAPEPFYDPLTMAVEEAHKRGMELHTWFNPYRALLNPDRAQVSDNHLSKTNPRIVKRYGNYLWMDPSDKETQAHSLAVVLDVVKRYDIDGIHVDDYFYPYEVADPNKPGAILDFPDQENWDAYQKEGGKLSRGDWRRDGVNKFIKGFYDETKKIKPWVKVGISPFGIWKPGYPAHIKGLNQYEKLYADALLWVQEGWVDYYTPQLYWTIANPDQSFASLMQWWVEESQKTSKRPIWPGMHTGKYNVEGSTEILDQIKWSRAIEKEPGQVHFSMKTFFNNRAGLNDKLTSGGPYAKPAVVPAMPWLDPDAPAAPHLTIQKAEENIIAAVWKPAAADDAKDVRFWLVQWIADGKWKEDVVGAEIPAMKFKPEDKVVRVAVRAIDRSSNLGPAADEK